MKCHYLTERKQIVKARSKDDSDYTVQISYCSYLKRDLRRGDCKRCKLKYC